MNDARNDARAVVLLSGGLDSATVLAIARAAGHRCYALSFDYGQRHASELRAAARVARALGAVEHRVAKVDLGWIGGSALTSSGIDVPKGRSLAEIGDVGPRGPAAIPVTYVPARNALFLTIALAWGEVLGASDLFAGMNVLDSSGYPDCRPEFVAAFEVMANAGTKAGAEGRRWHVRAPLIAMTKAEIIRAGIGLGVDYALTQSCYDPLDSLASIGGAGDPTGPGGAIGTGRVPDFDGRDEAGALACGACDACLLRKKGFAEAGVADPTRYA